MHILLCVAKPEGQGQKLGASEGLEQYSGVRGWSLDENEEGAMGSGEVGESAEKCSTSEYILAVESAGWLKGWL